jgi:hypothetical protein
MSPPTRRGSGLATPSAPPITATGRVARDPLGPVHAAGMRRGFDKFWLYYASEPEDPEIVALRERVRVLETVLSQLVDWAHRHDPSSRAA